MERAQVDSIAGDTCRSEISGWPFSSALDRIHSCRNGNRGSYRPRIESPGSRTYLRLLTRLTPYDHTNSTQTETERSRECTEHWSHSAGGSRARHGVCGFAPPIGAIHGFRCFTLRACHCGWERILASICAFLAWAKSARQLRNSQAACSFGTGLAFALSFSADSCFSLRRPALM